MTPSTMAHHRRLIDSLNTVVDHLSAVDPELASDPENQIPWGPHGELRSIKHILVQTAQAEYGTHIVRCHPRTHARDEQALIAEASNAYQRYEQLPKAFQSSPGHLDFITTDCFDTAAQYSWAAFRFTARKPRIAVLSEAIDHLIDAYPYCRLPRTFRRMAQNIEMLRKKCLPTLRPYVDDVIKMLEEHICLDFAPDSDVVYASITEDGILLVPSGFEFS